MYPMYPIINGVLPSYVTVRRGLQGYRAITMVLDDNPPGATTYHIGKRDPSTYANRADALKRAQHIATSEGLQVVE